MTLEDLPDIIDEITLNDPIPKNESRGEVETDLFKRSMLEHSKELNRLPSRVQIEASWIRWKRERGLQEGLEPHLNLDSFYKRK